VRDHAVSADGAAAREGGGSVGLLQAWAIPGVSSFAFCLFFSKLIAYTFLYWLPYYIKSTPIEGRLLSAKQAGDLSTLFDVGGVAGGILAGHLSDKSGCSAVVATGFTVCSVPFLYMYRYYGALSFGLNVALMMATGFFVNGPYALITTAVSADLGSHESLAGNAKALATVTAIIDGMGSIGAAIGPLLTGYISERGGFDGVFLMLYLSALTAGLLLVRLCMKEVRWLRGRARGAHVEPRAWHTALRTLTRTTPLPLMLCVLAAQLQDKAMKAERKPPGRIGSGVQLTNYSVVKL
jgi:OPA family glycerol-3-phosphate transporter-like MFS transporter 1/2